MQVLRAIMKRSGVPLGVGERRAGEISAPAATGPRRNESAVRAGAGVAQEGAYLVGGFGRENVFELAGLLFDFGFAIHGEAVGEESLGEAMAADDAAGAFAATGRQFDDHRAIPNRRSHRLKRFVAGIHERLVVMRMRRMRR